jgi:sulfotransferase
MKTDKTFYFMAGLPRSGSTLLSSILNQNPRFYSGPSSPVVSTMLALENSFSNDELFLAYPKIQVAKKIIASILSQYYSDIDKPVVFDKNRFWVNGINYISGYFDIVPKVICPVRDISEILTSFIMMCRRNPYNGQEKINFIDEMLIKSNIPLTDDNRCEFLASPQGILGQSVDGIKKAIMEGYDHCLHFVEYKDLIDKPEETMQAIYDFLGEEKFEHTFVNLENLYRENDQQIYGLSDMHEVRPVVKSTASKPEEILSQNILSKCKNTEFWRTLVSEYEEEEMFDIDDTDILNSKNTGQDCNKSFLNGRRIIGTS